MIGNRIKLARRKAGLSLRGLSTAMRGKVTAQAIGKYERHEDVPSSGVLIALAAALGVSVAYLLDTQGIELTGVEALARAGMKPDYFSVRRAQDLAAPAADTRHLVVLTAARLGKARLIDNIQVRK